MAVKAAEREGKRSPLNMRTTAKLRDALESEASKYGRSLAQEVEARLEKSFQDDELLAGLIGPDAHVQTLIRVLATTIRRIELINDKRYVDDYMTLWQCKKGLAEALRVMLGPDLGDPRPADGGEYTDKEKEIIRNIPRDAALSALKDLGLVLAGPNNIQVPVQKSTLKRTDGGQG